MPLKLALAVRGTVAGCRLGALEGGGSSPPFQCIPSPPSSTTSLPRCPVPVTSLYYLNFAKGALRRFWALDGPFFLAFLPVLFGVVLTVPPPPPPPPRTHTTRATDHTSPPGPGQWTRPSGGVPSAVTVHSVGLR